MTRDWFDRLERGVTAPVADGQIVLLQEFATYCMTAEESDWLYAVLAELKQHRALHSDISAALERIKVLEARIASLTNDRPKPYPQECLRIIQASGGPSPRSCPLCKLGPCQKPAPPSAAMAAGAQGGEK